RQSADDLERLIRSKDCRAALDAYSDAGGQLDLAIQSLADADRGGWPTGQLRADWDRSRKRLTKLEKRLFNKCICD
ncbi:hypothetical protein LCGC14_2886950, partial [marine sediment metagenome]